MIVQEPTEFLYSSSSRSQAEATAQTNANRKGERLKVWRLGDRFGITEWAADLSAEGAIVVFQALPVEYVGPFLPPPAPGFERPSRRAARQRAVAEALLALYQNDGPDDYAEIDAAEVYALAKADGGLGELGRIMAFAKRLHYEIDQRYDGGRRSRPPAGLMFHGKRPGSRSTAR